MEERQTPTRRETSARIAGAAFAAVAMTAAWHLIGWPAPGASVALGFAVYWLLRPTPATPIDP